MSNENRIATSEEFKKTTKDLLAYIDSFCHENNIKYFAHYGTLIGAIRHKGFIPWDDDIDICMPREDYEKFVKMFNNDDGQHYVLCSETSDTYYNGYARACDNKMILKIKGTFDIEHFGAFVDVFPLDIVPESLKEREVFYEDLHNAFMNILYALPTRCYKPLPLRRRIKFSANLVKRIPAIVMGINNAKNKRNQLMKKYNNTNSELISCLFDVPDDRLVMRKDQIEDLIRVPFEDIEIDIPRKYDEILRQYYGDYMKLPPSSERYSHHHFTPFWNNHN